MVPCNLSATAKVRISNAFGTDYDVSFSPFSIVDATAPIIELSLQKKELWPPNGEMVDVGFSFSVKDNCDPRPHAFIKITSDEPATEGHGGLSSPYQPEAKILNGNRVWLRAQRSEDGNGRVYVIVLTAIDASNNSSAAAVAVKVNLVRDEESIDDGQSYDATAVNWEKER